MGFDFNKVQIQEGYPIINNEIITDYYINELNKIIAENIIENEYFIVEKSDKAYSLVLINLGNSDFIRGVNYLYDQFVRILFYFYLKYIDSIQLLPSDFKIFYKKRNNRDIYNNFLNNYYKNEFTSFGIFDNFQPIKEETLYNFIHWSFDILKEIKN